MKLSFAFALILMTGPAFSMPELTPIWDLNFNNGNNGLQDVSRAGIQIGTNLYSCGYFGSSPNWAWGFKKMSIIGSLLDSNIYNYGGVNICDSMAYDGDSIFYAGYDSGPGNRRIVNKDLNGNLLWQKTFGHGRYNGITIMGDNLYLCGSNGSTGLFEKINKSGALYKAVADTNNSYFDNAITNDGTYIYVAGETANFGGELLITKLDSDLKTIWTQTFFSESGEAHATGIAYLNSKLYIAGYRQNGADTNGVFMRINSNNGSLDWNFVDTNSNQFYSVITIDEKYVLFSGSDKKNWYSLLTDLSGGVVNSWTWDSNTGSGEARIMNSYYNGDGNLFLFGYGQNLVSDSTNKDWWIKRVNLNTGFQKKLSLPEPKNQLLSYIVFFLSMGIILILVILHLNRKKASGNN